MFYQTTIKAIGNGGVFDINGKWLSFIGFLRVNVGDSVWTDGRVIFGHSSPKSDSLITDNPKVVPVLDDSELRGFFKLNGDYKDYPIIQDDWIINDLKFFRHGSDSFNDREVIDSEISDDGDLFVVTNGFFRVNHSITYKNHLYKASYYKTEGHDEEQISERTPLPLPHAVYYKTTPFVGGDITLGSDAEDVDDKILFYKNGVQFDSFSLHSFADSAQSLALSVKDKLMAESFIEQNAVNWEQQPEPPTDFFIASSYARVTAFHIHKNGDWDALIFASSFGYCFPYLTLDASIFPVSFPNGEDKIADEDLAQCLDNFEYVVFNLHSLPFEPDIPRYPLFQGSKTVYNSVSGRYEYSSDYKNFARDAIAYYIPLARFRRYRWFPVLFNSYMLFKVHNGDIVDTVFSNAGGSLGHYNLTYQWSEKNYFRTFPHNLDFSLDSSDFDFHKIAWDFPLGENWYFSACGLLIHSVFNSETDESFPVTNDLANALVQKFLQAYFSFPIGWVIDTDDYAVELAKTYTITHNPTVFYGYYRLAPSLEYYFVRGDYSSHVYDVAPIDSYSFLSGWFRINDDGSFDDNLLLNFSFCKLTDHSFLIGLHNGSLFKVSSDYSFELITDNLKNFRLRPFKSLAKTRAH